MMAWRTKCFTHQRPRVDALCAHYVALMRPFDGATEFEQIQATHQYALKWRVTQTFETLTACV